jgi:hypothetical protein
LHPSSSLLLLLLLLLLLPARTLDTSASLKRTTSALKTGI